MKLPAHLDHVRRLAEMLKAGEADRSDAITTVPIEDYRSPERFAAERGTVFFKLPVIAAASHELREPGTGMTHDSLGARCCWCAAKTASCADF